MPRAARLPQANDNHVEISRQGFPELISQKDVDLQECTPAALENHLKAPNGCNPFDESLVAPKPAPVDRTTPQSAGDQSRHHWRHPLCLDHYPANATDDINGAFRFSHEAQRDLHHRCDNTSENHQHGDYESSSNTDIPEEDRSSDAIIFSCTASEVGR